MRTGLRRAGQTMTEYVFIAALVAIGLLLVVTFFGNDIKALFFASDQSLRKGQAVDPDYAGKAVSGGGAAQAGGRHGLGKLQGEEKGGGGANNPYEWNDAAQRWYDPKTKQFVSFEAAGEYVDDPRMYYDPAKEPGGK